MKVGKTRLFYPVPLPWVPILLRYSFARKDAWITDIKNGYAFPHIRYKAVAIISREKLIDMPR